MDRTKTIVDVKQALADKYEHRSKLAGSKPKRHALARQAVKYRRQAAQLKQDGRG